MSFINIELFLSFLNKEDYNKSQQGHKCDRWAHDPREVLHMVKNEDPIHYFWSKLSTKWAQNSSLWFFFLLYGGRKSSYLHILDKWSPYIVTVVNTLAHIYWLIQQDKEEEHILISARQIQLFLFHQLASHISRHKRYLLPPVSTLQSLLGKKSFRKHSLLLEMLSVLLGLGNISTRLGLRKVI